MVHSLDTKENSSTSSYVITEVFYIKKIPENVKIIRMGFANK